MLYMEPSGLWLAGVMLAKRAGDGSLEIHERRISALLYAAYGKQPSPRAMQYIKRAGELMAEVKDSDWDNCTPHHSNAVPVLAKVHMLLALSGVNNVKVDHVCLAKAAALLDRGVYTRALRKLLAKDDSSDDSDEADHEDEEGEDAFDDSEGDDGSGNNSDFDAKHPRWPAGIPGGIGGEFAPKGSAESGNAQDSSQQNWPDDRVDSSDMLEQIALLLSGGGEARAIISGIRSIISQTEVSEEAVNGQVDADNVGQNTADPAMATTDHGAIRASARSIADTDIQEAMDTASQSGNVITQKGKYGTPQNVYNGTNGVTVVIETSGRNAGKIITVWRK